MDYGIANLVHSIAKEVEQHQRKHLNYSKVWCVDYTFQHILKYYFYNGLHFIDYMIL
jgi:hypothetical protein